MNTKKLNALWKTTMNKVQDVVADPRTVKVTEIAGTALDIAAKVGMAKITGPLGVAGMVLGTVNQLRTSMHVHPPDPITQWQETQKERDEPIMTAMTSGLPGIMQQTGAMDLLPTKVFVESKEDQLVGMDLPKNQRLAFRVKKDKSTKDYQLYLWRTPELDLSVVSEALWKTLPSPMAKLVEGRSHSLCSIEPDEDADKNPPYVGIHNPKEFADIVDIYHARNISRGALLIGPPGSGKTSFTRAYARAAGKTLLIIPPAILGGSQRGEIELFINLLQPGVLLLDDIDRCSSGLPYAMTLVDDMRRKYPKMVLISTCNRITEENTALLRPGRVGERLEFLAPNEEDREAVMQLYMSRYLVDVSKYDIPALCAEMTHPYFTHDYVRFIAEQAVVMPMQRLLACVVDTNAWLMVLQKADNKDSGDVMKALSILAGSSTQTWTGQAGQAIPPIVKTILNSDGTVTHGTDLLKAVENAMVEGGYGGGSQLKGESPAMTAVEVLNARSAGAPAMPRPATSATETANAAQLERRAGQKWTEVEVTTTVTNETGMRRTTKNAPKR